MSDLPPAFNVQSRLDMEHGRSRFFLDYTRSILWYVVNRGSPSNSRIDELHTGMKYAALFISPLPLLTGIRISKHMRPRSYALTLL